MRGGDWKQARMSSGTIELEYKRSEDGLSATLVASLPTVRAIRLGGAVTDLRLPGTAPDETFATIAHTIDHYWLERSGEEPVRVNGVEVPESGIALQDGDTIAIRDLRLTYFDGSPQEEARLIETHLRWRLKAGNLAEHEGAVVADESARLHIEEFDASTRPLLQAERYAEIQRMAEAELTRLIRLDQGEALEAYTQYLWWVRVRMAREAGDSTAVETAHQAVDLFPAFSPLLVACGVTFLTAQRWTTARDAFVRALRSGQREFLPSVHDARIGLLLAEHMIACAAAENAGPRKPGEWAPWEWEVPLIRLHTPGDELLAWRIARFGRVFGPPTHLRFVFRGLQKSESDGEQRQRWEIFDAGGGQLWRRVLVLPPTGLADPSLMVEAAGLRELLEKTDRSFLSSVLDWSHEASELDRPPVLVDQSALAVLLEALGGEKAWVRLFEHAGSVAFEIVPEPREEDLAYRQGSVGVALSGALARRVVGGQLFHSRRQGFYLEFPSGQRYAVVRRSSTGQTAGETGGRRRWGSFWSNLLIIVGVLLLLGSLIRFLLPAG